MSEFIPLDDAREGALTAASLVPYESSPEPTHPVTGSDLQFNAHVATLKNMHVYDRAGGEDVIPMIAEEIATYGKTSCVTDELNVFCPHNIVTGTCQARNCPYVHRFDRFSMSDRPCPKGNSCPYYGLAPLCCPYNHDMSFRRRAYMIVVFNRYGVRNSQNRRTLMKQDEEILELRTNLKARIDRVDALRKELDTKHADLRAMQIELNRARIAADTLAKEAAAAKIKLEEERSTRQELIHMARTRESNMRAEFVAIRDRCASIIDSQQKNV